MPKGIPGSNRPDKSDGYVRIIVGGKRKLEHVHVWESNFGPIPSGHHIHHKNGLRADNRPENLAAMKPLDHARLHAGYKKDKQNRWWKKCNCCRKFLLLEAEFYRHFQYKPSPHHVCKTCWKLSTNLSRNKRKLANARKEITRLNAEIARRRNV